MQRKLRAFLAIGAATAGLAACSDQPTSAPVAPRMVGVGVNADALPACSFTTLKDAVRAYADVNGNDVIFNYIRDMSTDPYGQGMNGLARLADIRANGPKKAGAGANQGAAAATAFLACMPIGGAVQDGFATNIVSAFAAGGLFEVPATASTDAIFSRGEPEGATFWAAKPANGASWGSLTAGVRYVVFGYKINGGNGFDYNTVPILGNASMPGEFASDLIVGACGSFGAAIRILHVADVLFDQSMAFCLPDSPGMALRASGFGSDLAMLVRRSLSVFAPTSVHAFGGGVGGAISEMSPTNLLNVTPTITYTPQPAKTPTVGQPLGVKVSVFSGSNPLKDAIVTLTITGNSGLNALFLDPPPVNKRCYFIQRTTNAQGVADFSNIPLLKPGGYTLTATATWNGLSAQAVVSDPTNVKNNNKFVAPIATC